MKKLLAAAVFAATLAGVAPSAQACTIETCWFTAPACAHVDCDDIRLCYYQPGGGGRCIIGG